MGYIFSLESTVAGLYPPGAGIEEKALCRSVDALQSSIVYSIHYRLLAKSCLQLRTVLCSVRYKTVIY